MKASSFSRRSFLAKVTTGTIGLTIANSIHQDLFPADLPLSSNGRVHIITPAKKFVPVMLTPYNATLGIDFAGLSKLIDFYQANGAKGFFANCLSSEMYNLDDDERLALVRHVVNHVQGKMPVVATGSFGASIEERATFTKRMYDTGVDAVILITSHFAAKDESDDVLLRNLEKFLKLTSNIPLGTYECPSPYKRILSPRVFQYLLSTNRLVYHKDTCLDQEMIRAKLQIARGNKLEFYDAHTPNAMFSLGMGATGMSCIAGNFYPEIFAWMCDHVTNPKAQTDVKWLQAELTRVDSIISKGYSLSAKYFLQKRGLPIEINSRNGKSVLTHSQKETLDNVCAQVASWRERLGVPVLK